MTDLLPGKVVTLARLQQGFPQGLIHAEKFTSSSGTSTSAAVTVGTWSVDLPAGRIIKCSFFGRAVGTSSQDRAVVTLRQGATVGSPGIARADSGPISSGATTSTVAVVSANTIDSGAGGTTTFGLFILSVSENGVRLDGSAEFPTVVTFEDLGPA